MGSFSATFHSLQDKNEKLQGLLNTGRISTAAQSDLAQVLWESWCIGKSLCSQQPQTPPVQWMVVGSAGAGERQLVRPLGASGVSSCNGLSLAMEYHGKNLDLEPKSQLLVPTWRFFCCETISKSLKLSIALSLKGEKWVTSSPRPLLFSRFCDAKWIVLACAGIWMCARGIQVLACDRVKKQLNKRQKHKHISV